METIKFTTCDGRFEVTVVNDFRRWCSNPEEFDIYTLNTQFKMQRFLHNLSGPAIIDKDNGNHLFFIEGKAVPKDEIERLKHNIMFKNKVDKLFDDSF